MKVTHVHIENFKRFSPPGIDISFERTGDNPKIHDQVLLLGDNATGKTTVLQAIALTLSMASKGTRSPDLLRWTGWAGDRYFAKGEPIVELTVAFSEDEIEATRRANRLWWDAFHPNNPNYHEIPALQRLTLRLRGTTLEPVDAPRESLLLFQGRMNAAALVRRGHHEARVLFPRLPGIFWFDQFRNVAMVGEVSTPDAQPEAWEKTSFQRGLQYIQRTLEDWDRIQRHNGTGAPEDLAGQLDRLYLQVFPGRKLAGFEAVYGAGPTPVGSRAVLTDGTNTYDLREMSAGEQAVFPLLFEFVRLQIHRSVVLIDEIDLNLHPPVAQRLLGLLPRLGEDNQFLFTTHAGAVSALVSPRATVRLPGGSLCL